MTWQRLEWKDDRGMETQGLEKEIFQKYFQLLIENEMDTGLIEILKHSIQTPRKPDYQQITGIIDSYLNEVGNED
jgi:hypothetical protein